jgi:hypothetical protein
MTTLKFDTLQLQNVETIDGSKSITGIYNFIGKIENTRFIIVQCIDTNELFIIDQSNLYK